jgi:hypothetical protein
VLTVGACGRVSVGTSFIIYRQTENIQLAASERNFPAHFPRKWRPAKRRGRGERSGRRIGRNPPAIAMKLCRSWGPQESAVAHAPLGSPPDPLEACCPPPKGFPPALPLINPSSRPPCVRGLPGHVVRPVLLIESPPPGSAVAPPAATVSLARSQAGARVQPGHICREGNTSANGCRSDADAVKPEANMANRRKTASCGAAVFVIK